MSMSATHPALTKSALTLAISCALASGAAQAVSVGTEAALRAAIDNSEPVITLTANISLTADLPTLLTATTVEGSARSITGNGYACFESLSHDLTIRDLTLTSCETAWDGGAIFVSGADLSVSNSTLTGNSSAFDGGAILVYRGNLELVDSTVSGNTAAQAGGGIAFKYDGEANIRNSEISGNTAVFGGGLYADPGPYSTDALSAGISIESHGLQAKPRANGRRMKVDIESSEISGNNALSPRGAAGGGIFLYDFDSLIIRDSLISGNSAMAEDDIAYGGGIVAYSYYGIIRVENTVVTGNRAVGESGLNGARLAQLNQTFGLSRNIERWISKASPLESPEIPNFGLAGGGAFFGSSIIRSSTFSDNEAGLIGGGILAFGGAELFETTVSGNAAAFGGGISVPEGLLKMDSSTVSGNTAFEGAGVVAKYGAEIENSTISGNEASLDFGGIVISGPFASSVRFSTIFDNTAGVFGGGLGILETRGFIGEAGDRGTEGADDTVVDIFASIVAGNSAGQEPDLAVNQEALERGTGSGFNVSFSLIGTPPTEGLFNEDSGTLIGVDPMLAPLAENGGPTQSHLPMPGSPVLGLVPASACDVNEDQRGIARPGTGGCSAGSVEAGITGQPDMPPVPIPLMNRVGLSITAGLLALFGLLGLRRRRLS